MENLRPELRFPEFNEEWNTKKLGELCTVKGGKRIPKGYSLQVENNGLPYITVSDMEGGSISLKNIRYVPVDVLSQIKNYTITTEDIYISVAGTLGLVGVVPTELAGANLTENANKLTNIKCVKFFLLHYLNSPLFSDYIDGVRTLGAQPKLAIYAINSFGLAIPSLPEQTKIAEFLTAIDKRIELLTTKKEKLTLYKKGVMQKIFNQEIRFKPDGGGEFPEWEEKRLGGIGNIVKLKNKQNNVSQVFTNSAKYGVIQQEDFFDREITTEVNLTNYYIISNGQFVYNPRISNLAPVGPISMNKLDKGLLSPLYTVFSITDGYLPFFDQYFKSTLWHQYIRDNGNSGARSDRMNVSTSVLMNLPLFIPLEREQIKIANFLSSIDSQIQTVEEQITLNQKYKKGLLQKMFV